MVQARDMERWEAGFTQAEVDDAQERYGLRFPPDLIALFLERRPTHGYSWNIEDPSIREMLAWPLNCLLFDVENGFWWPDWGLRPQHAEERKQVVRQALDSAPRLIPLIAHRFIPETPHEAGNPVFSMHGFDTIYYGANLSEFFVNEFEGKHQIGSTRRIPFWSDIVEDFDKAYAFYAASEEEQSIRALIQERLDKNGL